MTPREVIQTTIANYFAANRTLDVERFVNTFAPDAAIYNVGEISPITGLEAIRIAAEQMLTPFSKLEATIKCVIPSADGAAVYYVADLTVSDGRIATVEGIDVFDINPAGKIQALRYYMDATPLADLFS